MVMIAFFNALMWIPAVALNFAEELIIHHHLRPAILMMFQTNEAAVAEFFTPSGKLLGDNVSVDVNFAHMVCRESRLVIRGAAESKITLRLSSPKQPGYTMEITRSQ